MGVHFGSYGCTFWILWVYILFKFTADVISSHGDTIIRNLHPCRKSNNLNGRENVTTKFAMQTMLTEI